MTAPDSPLVEVISEALYDDSNTRQMGPPWSEYIKTSSRVDYWRDKARAVLAAISEVGNVEWGLKQTVCLMTDKEYHRAVMPESKARAVFADYKNQGVPTELVMRWVGPWERVE